MLMMKLRHFVNAKSYERTAARPAEVTSFKRVRLSDLITGEDRTSSVDPQ